MSSYRKGYRFELRVRKWLEVLAFQVMRSAQSRGPADLAAFGHGQTLLFACKVDKRDFTEKQRHKLRFMAREGGARAFLVSREGRRLYFSELLHGYPRWTSIGLTEKQMRQEFGLLIWKPDEEKLPPWHEEEE